MRTTPGFLLVLQAQLESLSEKSLGRLNAPGGLEISDIFDLVLRPVDHTVDCPYAVNLALLVRNEDISVEAFWLGKNSLVSGETAHCILVDEVSFTRQSSTHPTLLELQLMKVSWVKNVWIFVEPSLLAMTKNAVENVGSRAHIFEQLEMVSLTPNNEVQFSGDDPVFHGCGTGDLISVVTSSDVFKDFLANGGKYINVCTANNYLGSAHPVIVGQHIISKKPLTCEVTAKKSTDKSPLLCEHAGFPQLVEKFRFSPTTDLEEFDLVSTDNMVLNADLDFSAVVWKWHRIKKAVGGRLDVRFVRFLSDLTATYQTQFIKSPRHFCYLSTQ